MDFGIWPGVVRSDLVRFDTEIDAPPEDIERTRLALTELAGQARRFYVRCYRGHGGDQPPTPASPRPYLGDNRVVDLVLGYGCEDPAGFARAAAAAVREVAELGGGKIQVCEEVNAPAPQDGGRAGCHDALARGLTAALAERDRLGAEVLVGFNAAVALPGDPFWDNVRSHVPPEVLARVDYVGLDFFPDVFRPLPAARLPGAVQHVLRAFRDSATDVGLPPQVPIHLTETGWPTGPEHPEHQQAQLLGTVAGAVLEIAAEVNIDAYELFGLRDGLTTGPRMNRFGILRDDHSPKPAFETFRHLIAATRPVPSAARGVSAGTRTRG